MARKKKLNKIASKIPHWVEAFVVELSLQHPDYGARRLVPLLENEGITLTTSAVYTILKRNDLQNRSLRLAKLEEKHTTETAPAPADTSEPPAPVPVMTAEITPERHVSLAIKPPSKTRVRRPWSLSPVNILLLGLVGYFWVSALGNLLEARREPTLPKDLAPLAVESMPQAIARPLEDYNIIFERNLFGGSKGEASAANEEVSLEGLPVALKVQGLKLVGTVVGDDSAMSLAIIDEQSTKKQEIYHEGDQVGQALLKKILRNKVVLSTASGDEVLAMEFEESGESQKVSQTPLTGQPQTTKLSADEAPRKQIISGFPELDKALEQVQISPYLQGDKPAGLRISGTGQALARLRLRSGDVITGANGETITDPDQARALLDKLAQGEEVTLDILRQNRPRKIRIR